MLQVTPVGGWASEATIINGGGSGDGNLSASIENTANEETANELDEAEKQLAKDLAELQALMAEHSDIPGAGVEMSTRNAEEPSGSSTEAGSSAADATTTSRAQASPMGSGDVKGSMMGSDDDALSPSAIPCQMPLLRVKVTTMTTSSLGDLNK